MQSFEKLKISDVPKMPPSHVGIETPPPVYESVVNNTMELTKHSKKDSKQTEHHPKRAMEKKGSKMSMGCFQRPKLPSDIATDVKQKSAIRDDLGRNILTINCK